MDYCINEPCSSYSNCHTCTADPFCGFCHGSNGDKVCVEGEKNGPLTGYCPPKSWDHAGKGANKCSESEYFNEKILEGATGIAGTDEAAAAKAISDMEKMAGQMSGNEKNALATENTLLEGEKKSMGLVGHLKKMISQWKARKLKIKNAEHLDRGFFEAKWKALQADRKGRLMALQKIESQMVGDITYVTPLFTIHARRRRRRRRRRRHACSRLLSSPLASLSLTHTYHRGLVPLSRPPPSLPLVTTTSCWPGGVSRSSNYRVRRRTTTRR